MLMPMLMTLGRAAQGPADVVIVRPCAVVYVVLLVLSFCVVRIGALSLTDLFAK